MSLQFDLYGFPTISRSVQFVIRFLIRTMFMSIQDLRKATHQLEPVVKKIDNGRKKPSLGKALDETEPNH
jgi:hypothetical protein